MNYSSAGKPWLSNNGLRAERRTCRSIHLTWDLDTLDSPVPYSSASSPTMSPTTSRISNSRLSDQTGDDKRTTSVLEDLDEEHRPWYEVQMKLANTDQWTTVYKGFNMKCEVKDLNPDANINFRLRKKDDTDWGSTIIAATDAAPPNAEDLHRAIHCNAEEMVLRIIGASRNAHVKTLLESHDRCGMTPLMISAQNGNNNIISVLIQSGARVNAQSLSTQKTALMFAAFHGHLSTVQLLDRAGAEWGTRDKTGCNSLHHAINGGHLRIVLYTLDRTGRELINDKDDSGWTPLMRAVVVGTSTEIVKLLLLRGADPNATDKINTKSCLMAAALLGKQEMVSQLLIGKADPTYINSNDKSILDVSDMFGNEDVKLQITAALNATRKRVFRHTEQHVGNEQNDLTSSSTSEKQPQPQN